MIDFDQIPSNIRVPGVFVEVTNILAQSGLQQLNTRILMIGQRLSAGTVTAGVPTLITSKQQAVTSFGRGSQLALALEKLFDNNPYTEKWAVALDDNGSGVAATGTLTVTGTATADGTINLYIGGVNVQTLVEASETQNTVATNIAAAINANLDLPVTAAAATNVVTLTARNKGEIGNTIDLRLNYLGALGGEALPAGVSIAITQMASGATNPDIDTAIAALPDEIYNFWGMPYTDSANLTKLKTELDSRWSPLRQLDGHAIAAKGGSVSTVSTLGLSQNNQHLSIMDAAFNSPTPAFLWMAAVLGQVAFSATNDPARPFNTLPLIGILPAPAHDRRTITERNTLLYDGIATHTVARDGTVEIERLITTYQTNSAGAPDSSYLDANILFNLSFIKQQFVIRMKSKFSRKKLADDGTVTAATNNVVTPKSVRGEIISFGRDLQAAGSIDDIPSFIKLLLVERSTDDRNRLNILLPPTLVGGLQILAAQLAYLL